MRVIILLICLSLLLNLNGNGQEVISYHLDNHGRIKSEVYPDSTTIKYTHDLVGNIKTKVTSNPCSERPTPILTVSGPLVFCNGDSVILTAPNSPGYLWSTGDTTESIIVKRTGNYTVTTKPYLNCLKTSSPVNITVNPPPLTINSNDSTSFCPGGSTTLTSSLIGKYLWNTGDTVRSIKADTTKTYTLTYTDSNGCKATDSQNVVLFANPKAKVTALGVATFCPGDSVVIKADTSKGFSFQWLQNNSLITSTNKAIFSARSIGDFSVLITDSNGCKDTSNSINVTHHPKPDANLTVAGASTFCAGDSTLLQALPDSTNFAYRWYLNNINAISQTSSSLFAKQGGAYKVIVKNGFGCTDTSNSVNIVVTPRPSTGSIIGNSNVIKSSIEAYSIVENLGSIYLWTITNGTILNGNGTDSVLVQWNNIVGTGQIEVVEIKGTNCKSDASLLSINISAIEQLSINKDTIRPPYGGRKDTILISSNRSWNASSNQTWALINVNAGNGNGSIILTTASNASALDRNALITITAGQLTKNVYIVQSYNSTGINDINLPIQITIYPNPSKGLFNIDFIGIERNKSIHIFDALGRLIKIFESDAKNIQINLEGFAIGIYSISIQTEHGHIYSNIIVE